MTGNYFDFEIPDELKALKVGDVASDSEKDPVSEVTEIEAMLIVLETPVEIKMGYSAVMHIHTAEVKVTFDRFLNSTNRKHKTKRKEPRQLILGDFAVVVMTPQEGLCAESFKECPPLGRFLIRDMGRTIGVGVIRSVKKK